MNEPVFVHLHNHTDYSLLESIIRIDDLIAQTLAYGMPAVAITDSNNTLHISGQCNLELPENKLHHPEYDDPEERSADDALRQMADHGLSERLAIIRTMNHLSSPQQEQG
jgi:DNA polymerase III alpha subunit